MDVTVALIFAMRMVKRGSMVVSSRGEGQVFWLTRFVSGLTNEPVTRVIHRGRFPGDAGYSGRLPLKHSGLASAVVFGRMPTLNPRRWSGLFTLPDRYSLILTDGMHVGGSDDQLR
jgi:hypothetical protein